MILGALGLAALVGGLFLGLTGSSNAQAVRAAPVSTTITIDPSINETFAPPLANAAPAMTAQQAWAKFENNNGATVTTIAPNTSVQLGLLTLPVGPDCGAECQGLIIQNGIAYTALNQLAYGYTWSNCPAGSTLPAIQCTHWIFLDANRGVMIDGVSPPLGGQNPNGMTSSPSAG